MLAGAEQFVVEVFRAKDDRFFAAGLLSSAQLIAVAVALGGAAILRAYVARRAALAG